MRNILILLLLLSFVNKSKSQVPDIILFNGKVFTSDTSNLYVEAIAIGGNRIIATGKNNAIENLAGKKTQVIDLLGKTVIPGFNDAHYHLADGLRSYKIGIRELNPVWKALSDSLKNVSGRLPAGEWIEASIGPSIANDIFINRFSLDSISTKNPIRLLSFWGHVGIFNSMGLKLMEIPVTQHDPKGGRYERMKDGVTLTGRCFEKNAWAPQSSYSILNSLRDDQAFVYYLRSIAREFLSLGITSMQNMCTGATAPDYVKYWKKAGLPLRLRLIRWADLSNDGKILVPGVDLPYKDPALPLLTVSGTKWLLDGTPIEGGAAVTEGYPNDPTHFGYLNYSQKEIESFLREAVHRNDQICLHVAGDSTVKTVLDIMETIHTDWKSRRTRFEHGDPLLPSEFERVKRLGIIVLQNPSHFDDTALSNLYPTNLAANCQQFRSLLKDGIPVAIGSDGPFNPFVNIMLAVTHRSHPDQGVTREEAVITYTKGSAYAEFAESEKGTITAGKLADLAVLSQDIFTIPLQQLPATRSVLTIVDGKIAYKE